LILEDAARRRREGPRQLENDVRPRNRPTFNELPRRRHVGRFSRRSAGVHPCHEVRISVCDSEALFAKFPNCGSANHGGIFFASTAAFMAFAQGRACSYVSRENGAASPGRWHAWQFRCRIGATSFVNVCAGKPRDAPSAIVRTHVLDAIRPPILNPSFWGADVLF
jgi:hypothetical protein